jgi:hypothetical protein
MVARGRRLRKLDEAPELFWFGSDGDAPPKYYATTTYKYLHTNYHQPMRIFA